MTLQVAKSQTSPDFAERVERYRQAKLAHQQTTDVPAPAENPLIEACVRRVSRTDQPDDFVADYEIIDDTPAPPTLAERKSQLIALVTAQENAAMDAIVPVGKRRLFVLKADDIARADTARMNDAALKRAAIGAKASQDRTAAEAQFLSLTENMAAYVAAGRSDDDIAFLAAEADRKARSEKVFRHGAELHGEIEDLDAKTIGAWAPTPFPV